MLKSLFAFALLALAVPLSVLAAAGPDEPAHASRALPAPSLVNPSGDDTVQAAPVFSWRPVRRAAKYEFQLSDDAGFRSLVTGGSSETMNTALTLEKSLPDGDYHWRVRALRANGDAGRWSPARSFSKRWSTRPALVAPANGASVAYPSTPLVLRWEPVPHAVKYLVTIAADPALATPVIGSATRPVETSGTSFAPEGSLEPGEYWWAVTPENAAGHRGARSAIGSFEWSWPSSTTTSVSDLNSDPRVFDPRFSWVRVPGAARYEVEVNSSEDFAVGSKVCCADKTIGNSLSPTRLFPNNTYYWRVRAFDADGKSGVWNRGTPFKKWFDLATPTVPNLDLRSNTGALDPGSTTDAPIVTWDPVPGASSYDVQLAPRMAGLCNWGAPVPTTPYRTASTAWTALASGGATPVPPHAARTESDILVDGAEYCVRVRAAQSGPDTSGKRIVSEWTYLGGDNDSLGFKYAAHPGPVSTTKVTAASSDYLAPTGGSVHGRAPLFTWNHVPGACGYFVVVAKDPEFTTIADVARTKIPAYAPRPATYSDESSFYYWAVLPVVNPGCGSVFSVIGENSPQSFLKKSSPPAPHGPPDGSEVSDQPTFSWGAAQGAREYRLQVAHDPAFGSLIDDVVTTSTAYTSTSTYPADALLYWRVRANDENGVGLTWSPTQTFRRRLPAPHIPPNPQAGEGMPVFSWLPVSGAVSYDVAIEEPDGDSSNFNVRGTVFTPVKAYGLGTWQWRVRANFPRGGAGASSGPYSGRRPFTRFINGPTGAHATRSGGGLVIRWDPSFALAKSYRVEFSDTSSFSRSFDTRRTENTGYAPTMASSGFQDGGPIFWRVAAVDEGGNVGAWSAGRVGLLRRMVVSTTSFVRRGQRSTVEVRVADARGRALRRARVTLRGAGVRAGSRRTSRRGVARFRVRPRVRGSIRVRVDKRGFRPGSATITVG